MVKNRQSADGPIRQRTGVPIAEVAFAAPPGTPSGVEVLSLAQLRDRAQGSGILSAPQRPTFHHLITLDSGVLWHSVDFTGYALEPGSWLWVRPGQVQQWHDLRQAEGTLILFEPDFLDPTTAEAAALTNPHAPVLRTMTGAEHHPLNLATQHLTQEFGQPYGSSRVHVAVLRHLLAALVLRLSDPGETAGSPVGDQPGIFLDFRDLVEKDFATTRRVEDYARQLGYSPRTLSRATLAAAGVGAKEFIDRRIILEAKRLLAHSNRTAAQIAAQLGFAEPTNFTKFFQQRTSTSPIAFRTEVRGTRHNHGSRPERPRRRDGLVQASVTATRPRTRRPLASGQASPLALVFRWKLRAFKGPRLGGQRVPHDNSDTEAHQARPVSAESSLPFTAEGHNLGVAPSHIGRPRNCPVRGG
jgi:AraC-like DNA-binding protein